MFRQLCFGKHVFVNKFGKFSHLETLETIFKLITGRIIAILMETSYFIGRNTKVNLEYIFESPLYLNRRSAMTDRETEKQINREIDKRTLALYIVGF